MNTEGAILLLSSCLLSCAAVGQDKAAVSGCGSWLRASRRRIQRDGCPFDSGATLMVSRQPVTCSPDKISGVARSRVRVVPSGKPETDPLLRKCFA